MRQHVLHNGLRVVVQPRPVGLAAIYLWIDAGSADESPGEYGAAHFLEHMLFKGTTRRGVGVAANEIEALGGDLNAFTTQEATVLHATVLAQGWNEALDVLADMALNSLIDPQEFQKERDVILEEIRGYDSMADERLHEAMARALYPEDPYGRPIAGSSQDVLSLTPQALIRFWRREWSAHRAILTVVGDVDPVAVFTSAQQLFGSWEPGSPRASRPAPPPFAGPSTAWVPSEQRKSRLVQLSWRTVDLAHADAPALDLLALLLGDGPGALIPERLADDELLADPWGNTSHHLRGGTFTLGFVPREEDATRAISRILQTLRDLSVEGLPADAVDRARAGMLSDFVFSAETVDGMANELATHEAWYGSARARTEQRERYAALRASDLDRVLRAWLTPERLLVGLHDTKTTASGAADALQAGILYRPPKPFRDAEHRLKNEIQTIIRPDHGEVVAISVAFLGGLAAMRPSVAGLAEAWAGMITAGADGMSAGRYSACVDATGGMVWGSYTHATFEIHGRFPRDTAAEGLSLVLMALADPEWDPDVWPRQRDELHHDVDAIGEDAGAIASRALWRAVYPDHPWGLPPEGTHKSINALKLSDISDLHERLAAGSQMAIAVTGPIPTLRVQQIVEDWLSDLPARPRRLPKEPFPKRKKAPHRRLTAHCDQSYALIGGPGLALGDPDRPAAHVLFQWLSAQGGPLFLELREQMGLAYAVGADSVESRDGGIVQAGLATDPDRLEEAVVALGRALDRIAQVPPTTEQVTSAVRALHGHRATRLQQAGHRASRLARAVVLGMEANLDSLPASWDRVQPHDVMRVARRLFGHQRVTVTVEPRR
jgi:zinc protease